MDSGQRRVAQVGKDDVVPTPVQANPTSSTPGLEIEKVQYTLQRQTSPTCEAQFVTVLEAAAWDDDGSSQSRAEATGRDVRVVVERNGRHEEMAFHLDGADVALPEAEITGQGFAARTTHVTIAG
jgi:hypothetical protein